MKKSYIFSIIFFVGLYVIISSLVGKPYILPTLYEIGTSFIKIVFGGEFLAIILSTLCRTFIGFSLSFILALCLALIAYRYKFFKEFLEPLYIFLKTIPNITYIIIALIWLGRELSVILVAFLVIFPIFYNSILSALLNIDKEYLDLTAIYHKSLWFKIEKVYIPLIAKDILIAINNCFLLAFKVSIMAEILAQVRVGIGKSLNFARINFLLADVFSWTIIIVIISAIFEYIVKEIIKRIN